MTKAHKNAEVIKAWADGKTIQWRNIHNGWEDFNEFRHCGPWDINPDEWRVKPEPKKGWVRMAEHESGKLYWYEDDYSTEAEIEALDDFIRWLSPRLDFDYPDDYEGV